MKILSIITSTIRHFAYYLCNRNTKMLEWLPCSKGFYAMENLSLLRVEAP